MVPRTTIKSVAASVGFKSADAFRRAFERQLGVAPSDFRTRFHPDFEVSRQRALRGATTSYGMRRQTSSK